MNKNKNKKLIFEGADCSGKSTIVSKIRELYPKLDIADRSFISDRVYANKFNRTKYLGVDITTYLNYWEQVHSNLLDTRIVLCQADWCTLAKRAIDKKESFCKNKTFEQIKEYLGKDQVSFELSTKAMQNLYGFKVLFLDTTIPIASCIKEVKSFIKDWAD